MNKNQNNNNPHFVVSHDFRGDKEYVSWLQEIKSRYQKIRSRIALQANYGMLEFNWLLGRDIVESNGATCNDCHVPHQNLAVYYGFKAVDG